MGEFRKKDFYALHDGHLYFYVKKRRFLLAAFQCRKNQQCTVSVQVNTKWIH